jgi:hypothetical protein
MLLICGGASAFVVVGRLASAGAGRPTVGQSVEPVVKFGVVDQLDVVKLLDR